VDILEANMLGGTGTHAAIGCPAGGKTGTTDGNTDAWFVGFTPRLATAVWVGYPNDRTQMSGLYFGRNVDGGTYPADIWGAYMSQAKGSYCGDFRPPTEPFQASPFFGKYSRSGAQTEPDSSAQAQPTPTAAPDQNQTGGRQPFDPGQYESPPQPPPATTPPDGGTGTGGATPQGTVPAPTTP
jgi:penicillin-binding protein 1A